MPTNGFQNSSGSQAWDVASNWSLGQVPQSGDDVTVNGPSTGTLLVTIAASDPAYTVASLSETTTTANDTLAVYGQLTVTGSTVIDGGNLSVFGGGSVTLNNVTLSNSGFFEAGNRSASIAITSLTAGAGSPGTFLVSDATIASVGSISGPLTIYASSRGLSVGSTDGTSVFHLNNGALNLLSAATSFGDSIASDSYGLIDLKAIPYQAGEFTTATLVTRGIGSVPPAYSIAIKSASNQTLYTFQNVSAHNDRTFGFQPLTFNLQSDGSGGTAINLSCYCADTRIAVPGGQVRVSELRIGDTVLTAAGVARPIKWIGTRTFAGPFLRSNPKVMPIRFRRGSLGDGVPSRDLLVSPEHAMFLDGLLIPARSLVNDVSVFQETGLDRVDYYHLELDSHDVILAESAPSETFVDDNSRLCFQNAHEFAAMFPDAGSPPAIYCAPRVEDGEVVAAIRHAIEARAGLGMRGAHAPLRGWVDGLRVGVLSGWAQNLDQPEVPVCLDVVVDGAVVARTLADQFRPDLLAAEIGSGWHGFRVKLPRSLSYRQIVVRRTSDGAALGTILGRESRAA